jgi:alanine dehydrogenase
MRYITEDEVAENLSMSDVIRDLKEALTYLNHGKARYYPRQRLEADGGIFNTMPAAVDPWHIAGLKTYYASKRGGRFVVTVFDTSGDKPLCIIEANKLGQLRTGALPAIVSRMLIRENDPVFTLIGSGYQAETQLEGILNQFRPAEIRVFSRNMKHAESFASKMQDRHAVKIKVVKTPGDALGNATLISSITDTVEPVIRGEILGERYHLNLCGANLLNRREADSRAVSQSEIVIVESLNQARLESAEISEFEDTGDLSKMIEMKDIFDGRDYSGKYGRSVFKTMGIGLEDLAAAHALMKNLGIS